jgi:membrane protease YdiL (CAAX protease family)
MNGLWMRLPVVVRAVLVGLACSLAGSLPFSLLGGANLLYGASVPWSVPLVLGWLWIYWRYLQGRWWPRSTAESRRASLRGQAPKSARVWAWTLLIGVLGLAFSFTLTPALGRLTPISFALPDELMQVPTATVVALLLLISVQAGVVEEASFRGYMQTPIERRHGIVLAVAVPTVVFGLGHLGGGLGEMNAVRMALVLLAGVYYGVLTHLTGSILPGVIIHAVGDAIGILFIWWRQAQALGGVERTTGLAPALDDPWFWTLGGLALVSGAAMVWAFARLAALTRPDRAHSASV